MKKKYLFVLLIVICLFIITRCNKIELKQGTDYHVRGEFTGKYLDISKRGYYIDTMNKPGAPYLYIICMGSKNTGGYSLNVKEVNMIDERTEIIIEEIAPEKGETVTTALTYPTIIVEFPKYQENIIIKNTKNEIFDRLN